MRMWFLVSMIIGFGFLMSSQSVLAQDNFLPDVETEMPLDSKSLQEAFSGQTHRGSYNFQLRNMDGFHFEERTSKEGAVLHRMGERLDMGIWEVVEDQICYRYDSPDLLPACFSFYQKGNCYYHYQETVGGVNAPRFTAVSVIKGEVPNCEAPLS